MKSIGGYFGLELNPLGEYHRNAIRLNTGRNALEFIILVQGIKKIHIPYFTCDVLLEPLIRNKISYKFYEVNENFEPNFEFSSMEKDEFFLYTNYFGLKDNFIHKLSRQTNQLIVDNAQSFFSKPLPGVHSFYTARKFFGVPDGAYLYSETNDNIQLEKDISYTRCGHLLKRIDITAEEGFELFTQNENRLKNNNIKLMSDLTQGLLGSLDYDKISLIRRRNFTHLHDALSQSNKLQLKLSPTDVPMLYPYWNNNSDLKLQLKKRKIYTPSFWPNVLNWRDSDTLEHKFAKEIIYLPIDQRYSEEEMDIVIMALDI